MRLYDTARRAVVDFEAGPRVSLYSCGITPYDAAHLGHAAVYLTFDVLQRRLRDAGSATLCVRNVTDVDDDILRKAREMGVHYLDLAAEEMARFDADMTDLGLLPVASEPRATSAISDILSLVGTALDRGHAYRSGGAVYFDVASFPAFGRISHFGRDEMMHLAAVHGGNPGDPAKRNPLDFILWQPSLADEPAWESRWGPGRPGWHVECSALALREIGPTVDIHGGGRDLVFPHHECETAQSEVVTGQQFVRHWLHVGLVGLEGEKMSKSLGNLVFVRDLLQTSEPGAIRLAIMGHHYRSDWEWSHEDLPGATARLARWREAMHRTPVARAEARAGRGGSAGAGSQAPASKAPVSQAPASGAADPRHLLQAVRERLDDDLDTPGALAAVDRWAETVLATPGGDGRDRVDGDGAADGERAMGRVADLLGITL